MTHTSPQVDRGEASTLHRVGSSPTGDSTALRPPPLKLKIHCSRCPVALIHRASAAAAGTVEEAARVTDGRRKS